MNAEAIQKTIRKTTRFYPKFTSTVGALAWWLSAAPQAPAEPFATLKGVPVPEPPNLSEFVRNKAAAIQLGKAFFWDMQVGSDAVQACASCHFAAGADPRTKNQLSPGLLAGDTIFEVGGTDNPNHRLTAGDFPFTRFGTLPPFGAPPFDAADIVSDSNDVASSMGVFRTDFVDIIAGRQVDTCRNAADPVFEVNGIHTRRVEPRNTPTFHNAVFNFRNFWDGRAQFDFNGRNPFGSRDPDACVWKVNTATLTSECVEIDMKFASLASQAVGPPRSFFEMSCDLRPFAEIGVKLLHPSIRPLGKQVVSQQDSVLGSIACPKVGSSCPSTARGLTKSYARLIQEAFQPVFWNFPKQLPLNPGSERSNDVIPSGNSPRAPTQTYTQMQENMAFFFGTSVMLYAATQVSDDTPADKFADAGRDPLRTDLLTARHQLGLQVFEGDGRCANCHGGAETTNASVTNAQNQRLERMQMGFGPPTGCSVSEVGIDGNCIAVYDNGFYNIGARPTLDDLGVGGRDPFGNPLSETEFCRQRVGTANPCQEEITCINERPDEGIDCEDIDPAGIAICAAAFPPDPGEPDRCRLLANERIAVDGNFKTPHLRNLLLTGPYFHNGGKSTLEQVVRAYNHGLDFRDVNQNDLDPDIEADLGLTAEEITALVDFLACGLLDTRVAYKRAPFDHPELFVPNGHPGNSSGVTNSGNGNATDGTLRRISAVGAGGVTVANRLRPFLNLDPGAGVTCTY